MICYTDYTADKQQGQDHFSGMLRSYASSLVIQIHHLVLKQVSKLSKMSNKHTGGDEKIISINLFTLVFSFKVHLCYMIQNKTLHEHV